METKGINRPFYGEMLPKTPPGAAMRAQGAATLTANR